MNILRYDFQSFFTFVDCIDLISMILYRLTNNSGSVGKLPIGPNKIWTFAIIWLLECRAENFPLRHLPEQRYFLGSSHLFCKYHIS